MKQGTVKFFNESKGFGFITEEGTNTEYFVHISGLVDRITEGDNVEFDLKEGKKGLNAVEVKVI
jgi:CspA family cold shock protein